MIDRPVRTAQELKMHAAILRVVGERGLGRRRIDEVTTADVQAMAHAAFRTLPLAQRSPGPMVSPVARIPARTVALGQEEAASAAVCLPAAPNPVSAGTETSHLLGDRERALQALRADATSCAVLKLVAEFKANQDIATQLGLTKDQVKSRVRRWLWATESDRRWNLAAWAERHGATGAGADQ